MPTPTPTSRRTRSPVAVPNNIYIHESKIQTTGDSYISYISATQETDTIHFTDVKFNDYEDAHNYILNEIQKFYNTFSSAPDGKDANNKTMQQRYLDIFSIQVGFSEVLKMVNTAYLGTDPVMLNAASSHLKSLQSKMDEDLNDVYGHDGSTLRENKLTVDSTIYTSVLWTILAVFLVYHVFIRM